MSVFSFEVFSAPSLQWIKEPQVAMSADGTFVLQAEALVTSPINRVLANSVDYEAYVRKQVPTVKDVKIISDKGNALLVWFKNEVALHESRFFVNVNVQSDRDSALVKWSLASTTSAGRYTSNDTVASLSGSWNLQADESGKKTHIVYRLSMKPKTDVPPVLIRSVLSRSLKRQVQALFKILSS
jgi:hypothetical protein